VLSQIEKQIHYDNWRHYGGVETGGLLLSHYEPRTDPADAYVVRATGPGSDSEHWESSAVLNAGTILRENADLIEQGGLLEVGHWHSHRTRSFEPSPDDLSCWSARWANQSGAPYVGVIVTPGELGWTTPNFHAWVTHRPSRGLLVCEPARVRG
jgi:hypothetical protein